MKADINNNIYVSGEGHSLYFFFYIKTEQCAKWQTVIFVAILVKDKLSKIKLHQQKSPVCESFKLFLIHISQSNLGHELVFSNLYSKLCSLKYNIATFLWILAITAICLRPCLLDIKKMIHATNLWHLNSSQDLKCRPLLYRHVASWGPRVASQDFSDKSGPPLSKTMLRACFISFSMFSNARYAWKIHLYLKSIFSCRQQVSHI